MVQAAELGALPKEGALFVPRDGELVIPARDNVQLVKEIADVKRMDNVRRFETELHAFAHGDDERWLVFHARFANDRDIRRIALGPAGIPFDLLGGARGFSIGSGPNVVESVLKLPLKLEPLNANRQVLGMTLVLDIDEGAEREDE